MKLVIGKPEKEAEVEKVVHVWLKEGSAGGIFVMARLADGPVIEIDTLLKITKHGIRRYGSVTPEFGFPLDHDGRLQLHC